MGGMKGKDAIYLMEAWGEVGSFNWWVPGSGESATTSDMMMGTALPRI